MNLRSYALGAAATLSAWALAQSSLHVDSPSPATQASMSGRPAIDLLPVEEHSLGLALRNPNVVLGSEQVELNGRILTRGRDYHLDAREGVIYLMVPTRRGDAVRILYRHDPDVKAEGGEASIAGALGGLKFDLVPGGMSMVLGLGMAERLRDGSVVRSNVYGLSNSFSLAPGTTLSGAYMVGDRRRTNARSAWDTEGPRQETEEGRSHYIRQSLSSNLLGGQVQVDYQDISDNFAGFGSLAASDPNVNADQMRKERGLVRQGISLQDISLGFGRVSHSVRSVSDGNGTLEWRSMSLQSGGLTVQYDSRKVDEDFRRFRDLAEQDREVLRKEAGINRENLAVEFKNATAGLKLNTSSIQDLEGNGIQRRDITLNVGHTTFQTGSQDISRDFTKFNGLMENERAQWARERGLTRQWTSLQTALFGPGNPINYVVNSFRNDDGQFRSVDFSAKVGPWSLETIDRTIDPTFRATGNLTPQELNAHATAIGKMYSPEGVRFRNNEPGQFAQGFGIGRSLQRISGEPFKGWNLRFDQLRLTGQEDGARVDSITLAGPQFGLEYRNQRMGSDFTEFTRLMDFERTQLGAISGLNRMDLNAHFNVNGLGKFAYSNMAASAPDGEVRRNEISVNSNSFDVKMVTREVDPGFHSLRSFAHAEKDLFWSIRGFRQRDLHANWNVLPGMKLSAHWYDAHNATEQIDRYYRQTRLDYAPDSLTKINLLRLERRDDEPSSLLFAHSVDALSLQRNFGRFGTVSFATERVQFDGDQATRPDSNKVYVGYETQLNASTTFRTEQTRTKFDDGTKENVSANTVSKEITPRLGVSVSDIRIDRDGDENDEIKRSYGFWYDFGRNLRVKYGVDRHLRGDAGVSLKSDLAITPGEAGPIKVDQSSYTIDRRDGADHNRHFGNFQLGTIAPVQIGFLRDFTFRAQADLDKNEQVWRRENRHLETSFKVGGNTFGYLYRTQLNQSGTRGTDRAYSFSTNNSPSATIVLGVDYKLRSLPGDEHIIMRNYNLTLRPWRDVELTHQVQTNPETTRNDAFLGSTVRAHQSNRWRLGFNRDHDTKWGFSWEELVDRDKNTRSRVGGIDFQFFNKIGSPLSFFYGVEQRDLGNVRQTQHRYHFRYDQKAGPNQVLSVFAGNVAYQHSIPAKENRNNWTIYVNYGLRF